MLPMSIKNALLRLTLLLAFASTTVQAYVTVRVEMFPTFVTLLPQCTSSFINAFESNLTVFVTNATDKISTLSDFTIPTGLHLTYFNNGNSTVRRNRRHLLIAKTASSICTTCTSKSCTLSCGIGTCSLCGTARRLRALPSAATTAVASSNQQRALTTIDWSVVGVDVSNAVQASVISYVKQNSAAAGGCLGDPQYLNVNVTYIANITFSQAMSMAVINAYGVPAPDPLAPGPNACCTLDFVSCVNYCGTTQQQCASCGDPLVAWLPPGPPKNNSCLKRNEACTSNVTGCCPGLSCVGDVFWKGCVYVPPNVPTPAPTPPLPGCCTLNFATCVSECGLTQQECNSCGSPGVGWMAGGPPLANSCTARWGNCTKNAGVCCPGLTCRTMNQWYSMCDYIPPPTSAPVLAPVSSSKACCSQDFKTCTTYCQTSQAACQTCTGTSVVWLPNGPPANISTCLPRWWECTNIVSSCCPGLTCTTINPYYKQCNYVP